MAMRREPLGSTEQSCSPRATKMEGSRQKFAFREGRRPQCFCEGAGLCC